MGFVRTLPEIAGRSLTTLDFYDAEMLTVVYETDPAIVKRLLPPPLEPARRPIVVAYVADFPRTNWGGPYLEAALFLRAVHKGIEGSYCLGMPVTDDMAMAGGREIFGFPKKIGRIDLERNGTAVRGWAERHGVRFVELRGDLGGAFNADDAEEILGSVFPPGESDIYYNFKHVRTPDWSGFEFPPRLVRGEVARNPVSVEIGEAGIVLRASDHDPWAEVRPVRVLGAIHSVGDSSMLQAEVVAEAEPTAFAPYSYLGGD